MYILTSNYFPTDYWPDLYFPALPEGADIQYKEVVEFTLAIASSAEFDVILPNDVEAVVGTMVVSGAGTSDANGTYIYLDSSLGRPSYKTADGVYWLWWNFVDGEWQITNTATYDIYYVSLDDVATPDLVTTWTVYTSGIAPVPTVTSGNPISAVGVIAPFTLEMPQVITMEVYEELSL